MSDQERTELLRKRVYFAARDGLAITLYALLCERNLQEQSDLLSQVLSSPKSLNLVKIINSVRL